MKKVLIFGCNGFVGAGLCLEAQCRGFSVYGADIGEHPVVKGIEYRRIDISDETAVREAVHSFKPDAAVNVAAIANIDFAEANREVTRRVNVLGAVNIAAACASENVRYVFFSSDAVFSGKEEGYAEDSPKAPVNYYGQTKSDAEDGILAVCKNAAIIRISLVLGFTEAGGNSFLSTLEKKLKNGESVICPSDEVRTPIDIATLISCVLELCGNDFSGIIHLGSKNSMNRYGITCRVARLLGFTESLVSREDSDVSGRAPRHKKGVISVKLAQKTLNTPLHDVEKTIEIAVSKKINNSKHNKCII